MGGGGLEVGEIEGGVGFAGGGEDGGEERVNILVLCNTKVVSSSLEAMSRIFNGMANCFFSTWRMFPLGAKSTTSPVEREFSIQ